MTVKKDIEPIEFEAWCGAVDTLKRIREENKEEEFNEFIENIFFDGVNETEFNDFLWFENDFIFSELGIQDKDEEN